LSLEKSPEIGHKSVMKAAAAALANTPELTVTELSGALKRTIEDRFGYVRVRGEITGYRGPHSSGHAYFALKDQGAKIDAVVWKTTFARMRVRPEEGLEVIAVGKVTTFPGKSAYQIIVESIEPAGAGALMAVLDGARSPYRDIAVLNAAAALIVAGKVDSLTAGASLAAKAIDSRAAKAALGALVRASTGAPPAQALAAVRA